MPFTVTPGHLAAGTAPDTTANDPQRALAAAAWTFSALTVLRGDAPASSFSNLSGLLLQFLSREEQWDDARERDLALLRARIRDITRGPE